jgi:hypothetical protein
MNRKQLLALLVVVLVVGTASMLVYKNRMEGRRSGNLTLGQKLLADFPVNDITRISIKQDVNELNLERKDDLWRVRERGGYPASFGEISGFLLRASDVKVMESEQVGPTQLARLSLAPGQGTNAPVVVDFIGENGKPVETLMLGKKQMRKSTRPSPMGDMDQGWAEGRYVKVGDKSDRVVLISEPFENIEPEAERWLNKDFIRIEKVRSVAVQYPEETNSWKLVRETENGEWKLADQRPGEELDRSKASGVSYPLSSPSFNDVFVGVSPEELGMDKAAVLTIETFDNFAYTVKAAKTNDNYAMTVQVAAQLTRERAPGQEEQPEDKARLDKEFQESQKKLQEKLAKEKGFENWIYEVSSWTLDPVLKERSQLLADKNDDKPEDLDAGPAAEEMDVPDPTAVFGSP